MKSETTPGKADVRAADEAFRLTLTPEADLTPRLCTLLQKGCYVRVKTGCSLRELLCDQFGIDPEYVRKDIKVFFINSSPVDNIDEAIIRDGATVALSASMPGLVGAAMRGDGLSWMRSSITYHDAGGDLGDSEGVIQLKLFNQVMADLGKSFLERAVYVKSRFLLDYFGRFGEDFWGKAMKMRKNGEVLSKEALFEALKSFEGMVKVRVERE
jgi:hypothetical protein